MRPLAALVVSMLLAGCETPSFITHWEHMSWDRRLCHARAWVSGQPAQLGDGRCESFL